MRRLCSTKAAWRAAHSATQSSITMSTRRGGRCARSKARSRIGSDSGTLSGFDWSSGKVCPFADERQHAHHFAHALRRHAHRFTATQDAVHVVVERPVRTLLNFDRLLLPRKFIVV